MKRIFTLLLLCTLPSLIFNNLFAQNTIPFGEVSIEDLGNEIYSPDPSADAIVLSDVGVASLNYDGREFYVELVRDVKIKIVNSNGFGYASVDLPFYSGDALLRYRASTFNIRDGEKIETAIPKNSFILDHSSEDVKRLKFNFPDVREGSVIEYSYTLTMKSYSVATLVPWTFQAEIPIVNSSLTIAYPDYFVYKNTISGNARAVYNNTSFMESIFYRDRMTVNVRSWYVKDMPAFRDEPYLKSWEDNITKISFELLSVTFPQSSIEKITPTYENLTEELLKRYDFGIALSKTEFLNKKALELTSGLTDDLSKVKKIHEYISNKILWNGVEDYATSNSLRKVYFFRERGNSADINFLLIGMLRALNIKANPVILSTRSNGSINEYSAMIQQFNYVVAQVYAGDRYYLIDATDPLRPFDILPFECLSGKGRLINEYDSKFVNLKNDETISSVKNVSMILDEKGNLAGEMQTRYSDYDAYDLRKAIILEGEEGYLDIINSVNTEIDVLDCRFENLAMRDSDVIETFRLNIKNAAQVAGNRILLNPFFNLISINNPFYEETRNFPIDLGAPMYSDVVMRLEIPDGFSLVEKPANVTINLGQGYASYKFSCQNNGNEIEIRSQLSINTTIFQPVNYSMIRDFFSRIRSKQSELLVFNTNL